MTIKLLVFDVDGTLAPTEEPIPRTVSEKIVHFEHLGFQIVFISGRTASYLAGLARGIGLKKPLVAGENGGVIFNPATKWEKTLAEIPRETAQIIKEALFKEFEGLWFQPNQTMLTAAPRDLSQIDHLYQTVLTLPAVKENNYKINKYEDAVEIMPQENSKGQALAVIKNIFGVKKDEIVVFGNTIVDLPMKDETQYFFIIGEKIKDESIQNFGDMKEALVYLEKLI
ncbi:MAG: HAD family phosphatase [Peptococcaceae bacterium]|nr:HAD family phosphatase [Peptococcaceae bacterium]